ncbi:MAG: type II toxin-antitoxin system VapC family toxin [Methanosarcinales archaeon]
MHKDFYDTSVMLAGFSPLKEDKIDIIRQRSSLKVLSRSKNREVKGNTSYLAIVEFFGVLAVKTQKKLRLIEKKCNQIKKFNIQIIYPTHRVKLENEYKETSLAMKQVLLDWTNDVIGYSINYQLNGLDASHLLTAVENGCTRFITWDKDFLSNPNFRTKKLKDLNYIQITSPDKIA